MNLDKYKYKRPSAIDRGYVLCLFLCVFIKNFFAITA